MWLDATVEFPDWLQITFSSTQSIAEISVFTVQDNYEAPLEPTPSMTFTQWGITDFQVQYWNGSAWLDVPGGNVTGNNLVWRKFTFTPISTHAIRVLVNSALNGQARIAELEAWTASAAPSQQTYFIHTDHLNTPRVISNSAAQIVWRWDNMDPFGYNAPNENPSGLGNFTCNLRFAGQYFDKETNLHFNYFRDYDPLTGRYVQSDPIGLAGGINTFAYVGSNPLSFADPFGLQLAAAGGAAVPIPVPKPPAPVPGPGVATPPGSGDVIPFPGTRDRPTDRPDRPGSRVEPDFCPRPDAVCQFTGLAVFEAAGSIYQLSCQYRCPNKGIRYTREPMTFFSENPRFLCPPQLPESAVWRIRP